MPDDADVWQALLRAKGLTVAQLAEQGFLEQKPSADGQVFYRVSARYLSTLQQRPPNLA